MFKETPGSLNTASGHSLLRGPGSQREGSISRHVAVCTGHSSHSPPHAQYIKTQFPSHVRNVKESPDGQMQNDPFISLPPLSQDNCKCTGLNLTCRGFFLIQIFLQQKLWRGIKAEVHEKQLEAHRDIPMIRIGNDLEFLQARRKQTQSPVPLKSTTVNSPKEVEQFQGCNGD